MTCALQLEKNVNQALLDLHKIASEKVDPHVSNHHCPMTPPMTTVAHTEIPLSFVITI